MKLFYRIIAVLAVFSIIVSMCGCFGNKESGEEAAMPEDEGIVSIDDVDINIPYSVRDSFNPFKAQTDMNRALTSLMYDGLFAVDNTFKAVPLSVSSYDVTDDAVNVTVSPSAVFSDGSPVGVTDVIYSFDQAKKCERYKSSLSCFKEAYAQSADTVSFVFKSPAANAENLLTFPLVKSETNDNESEEKLTVPTGSGRYVLSFDENNNPYLACNPKRLGGYKPIYNNIGLVSIADNSNTTSSFSLGQISFLVDRFNSGGYTQTIGTSTHITMPNFVYLVFNSGSKLLKDSSLRRAISLAADRQELADFSFISYAKPAFTPFHSDYYKLKGIETDTTHSTIKAVELLESLGYKNINERYNFRFGEDGGVLEFTLAVCQDNEFKLSAAEKLKEQLDNVNIKINIYKYAEKDFFKVISSGQYDMYLGECKLKNNLDISEFFDRTSQVSSGIDTTCESAKAWNSYQKGETELQEFLTVFADELPFLPLLYRNGRVASHTSVSVPDEAIVTDYYYNADKWMTVTNDQ
ncbi:MAG: ABC transporter substrate-binding protein [Clostridia bacterium]|nr:ABC transporter substrate-binding protein [Clostridia bacterium]